MELENIDPETVPNARIASLKVNMVCLYVCYFLDFLTIIKLQIIESGDYDLTSHQNLWVQCL